MKYKIFLVLVFAIIILIISRKFFILAENKESSEVSVKSSFVEPSTLEVSHEVATTVKSKPKRLIIPSLKVNSSVEIVGKDSEGRMDVPKIDMNVAWWKFGSVPGEKGNAVIAGHYDTKTGDPAVFYDLGNLKVGDEIISVHENEERQIFEIYRVEKYKDSQFPLDLVFGGNDSKNLNLITCAGEFSTINNAYSDRLVVFSHLKDI